VPVDQAKQHARPRGLTYGRPERRDRRFYRSFHIDISTVTEASLSIGGQTPMPAQLRRPMADPSRKSKNRSRRYGIRQKIWMPQRSAAAGYREHCGARRCACPSRSIERAANMAEITKRTAAIVCVIGYQASARLPLDDESACSQLADIGLTILQSSHEPLVSP
jgi:hypothetical protein